MGVDDAIGEKEKAWKSTQVRVNVQDSVEEKANWDAGLQRDSS